MEGTLSAIAPLVRRELDCVLRSEAFAQSKYSLDFLRFIVESTLDGNSSQLKEYVIGVQVLGRPADYDPKLDPVVGMAARRLRKKLEDYYASTSSSSGLRISLPKGAYIPQFEPAPRAPADESDSLEEPTPDEFTPEAVDTPAPVASGPPGVPKAPAWFHIRTAVWVLSTQLLP
jgi:hypothetical protein